MKLNNFAATLSLALCLISLQLPLLAADKPVNANAQNASSQSRNTPAPQYVVASLNRGGRLVCNLDSKALIRTGLANVICEPGVTVYVFESSRAITVYNLDSVKRDDVKLAIGNKHMAIFPGEQVVVGRTPKAAFKDINPGLGIPYKSVRPIKVRPQLSAYSAEFALISAVSKISLLNKMIDSPKESDRNTINRILKNAAILQPRAGFLSKRPTNNGGAGGVISNGGNAMVSGALSANAENISTEKTKLLKGSAEIFAREKGRLIDLTIAKSAGNLPEIPGICWLEYVKDSWEDKSKLNGTKNSDSRQEIAGLVSCTVNTILKTDLGEIECKRGSQMFVVDRKDCVAICTLDASSIADVILHVGEKFTSKIPPGREILLTKDLSAPFENLCPARQISHRDSIELGTVSNTRVSAVEFSLPSAILAISPLGEKLSSNNAEDRKIVDAMLKNAVILTKITAADGPYRSAD